MFDSKKKVSYYIEIQMNKGKSLSDIKEELLTKGIPKELVQNAVNEAYKDEMKYIHSKYESKKVPKRRVFHSDFGKKFLQSLTIGIFISLVLLVIAYFLGMIKL